MTRIVTKLEDSKENLSLRICQTKLWEADIIRLEVTFVQLMLVEEQCNLHKDLINIKWVEWWIIQEGFILISRIMPSIWIIFRCLDKICKHYLIFFPKNYPIPTFFLIIVIHLSLISQVWFLLQEAVTQVDKYTLIRLVLQITHWIFKAIWH